LVLQWTMWEVLVLASKM